MDDSMSRRGISAAVDGLGWRYVLETLCAWVAVGSLVEAVAVARRAVVVAGGDADDLLRIDLRPDRVMLSVRSPPDGARRAVELARRLAAELTALRGAVEEPRSVHQLEVAIDALDIASVRPFWKAVLGYADRPGDSPQDGALVDPLGQGPAVWFQQLDAPRPQRNRIHLDVSVPPDTAPRRIEAALAAGGRLLSDSAAPAFWVLADAEGNEACLSTWQGRD